MVSGEAPKYRAFFQIADKEIPSARDQHLAVIATDREAARMEIAKTANLILGFLRRRLPRRRRGLLRSHLSPSRLIRFRLVRNDDRAVRRSSVEAQNEQHAAGDKTQQGHYAQPTGCRQQDGRGTRLAACSLRGFLDTLVLHLARSRSIDLRSSRGRRGNRGGRWGDERFAAGRAANLLALVLVRHTKVFPTNTSNDHSSLPRHKIADVFHRAFQGHSIA